MNCKEQLVPHFVAKTFVSFSTLIYWLNKNFNNSSDVYKIWLWKWKNEKLKKRELCYKPPRFLSNSEQVLTPLQLQQKRKKKMKKIRQHVLFKCRADTDGLKMKMIFFFKKQCFINFNRNFYQLRYVQHICSFVWILDWELF